MKCPDCSNLLIPHGRGKNTTLLCNQCGKKHALGSLNKSVFWKTEIDRLKKPTPDAKAGRHVCTECHGEGKTPKCPSCKYSKTIHGKQQVSKPSQRNNKNYTILRSNQAFDTGWSLMKEFIGPREKVEEGKRMVEGNKVRYGQRKWDGVVVPEQLGYIDEEGNEREMTDAYHKYKKNFPDIDMRYRHDQDMSSKPKPYTWDTSSGGEPYPQSARLEAARREKRIHDAKMQRERQMRRNGGRPYE